MESITNMENTIYSMDIIDRVEELEGGYDTCPHCGEGLDPEDAVKTNKCPDCEQELLDSYDMEELESLKNVIWQAKGCGDFDYGETLISFDYFTEYCKELCGEIGAVTTNMPWYIESNIDWEGVAEDIKMDYTEIDFDGQIFYMKT